MIIPPSLTHLPPSSQGAKTKRLIQEMSSLANGALPLFTSSSVFMRADSDRIDVMQVLITGPRYARSLWCLQSLVFV